MTELKKPTAEWVVFRTTLSGKDDYGTPMAKSSGLTDAMLEEGRKMVRDCHSDSEPAPKSTQYYCWIASDKRYWVLMSSGLNKQFEEKRDRAGREYIVVFMTDAVCRSIYPDGKPIYAVKNDLFGHVSSTVQGKGNSPIVFDTTMDSGDSRLAKAYDGKPFRKRFEQSHVDGMIAHLVDEPVSSNSRPSTFATWWSYTRPVLVGVFDSDMRSAQPDKMTMQIAIKQASELSTAVSALSGLDSNSLYLDVRRETREIVDIVRQLGVDATSPDSVWAMQVSNLSHKVTLVVTDIEKLMASADGNQSVDGDQIADIAERYQTFSDALIRVQRPIKPSFSSEPPPATPPVNLPKDTSDNTLGASRNRKRNIERNFQIRMLGSVLVCLFGFGLMISNSPRRSDKPAETNGGVVRNPSKQPSRVPGRARQPRPPSVADTPPSTSNKLTPTMDFRGSTSLTPHTVPDNGTGGATKIQGGSTPKTQSSDPTSRLPPTSRTNGNPFPNFSVTRQSSGPQSPPSPGPTTPSGGGAGRLEIPSTKPATEVKFKPATEVK